MSTYYIYPDGTIAEEPYDWMSDDYYIVEADDYEEAYEQAKNCIRTFFLLVYM